MSAIPPSHRSSMWDYYDRRVAEGVRGLTNAVAYWTGLGVEVDQRELAAEGAQVERTLRGLPPASFLEVGAGPGTFTGMLAGTGVALDQSERALHLLQRVVQGMPVVRGEALRIPLGDQSVARFFSAHVYGLLLPEERRALLSEARRVASEVVILDAGRPPGVNAEEWQERTLPDGSRHRIFRRHFEAEELASEMGGEVLLAGRFYVLVRST